MFKFLGKWSLQITGSAICGYHYFLNPDQQSNLYGLYRSAKNSYRTSKAIYKATSQYKAISAMSQKPEEYTKQLQRVNKETSQAIYDLCCQNKGLYIRTGQYISHLKYTLPSELTKPLEKINSWRNFEISDYQYLKKHIEYHFGKKTKEVFESLNTTPMYTDLFYQVYKGELLQNFLDITLKVIHPYAQSQAKYDLMFLSKATEYLQGFQSKHFPQSENLMLKHIYGNFKTNIQRELNFKEEQRVSNAIKQQLSSNPQQSLKTKASRVIGRKTPIYIPHRYQKYITEKIAIHEFFEGQSLKNGKEVSLAPLKILMADYVQAWNEILKSTLILNQSIQPHDIMVRQSRPNEEGPYQLCLMNFMRRIHTEQTFVDAYSKLWKTEVEQKKLSPKSPADRKKAIQQFYEQLPNVLFLQAIKSQQTLKELEAIAGLVVENLEQIESFSKEKLSKRVLSKIEPKFKFSKEAPRQPENYRALRKAFEIKYQPWKFRQVFNSFGKIFQQKVAEFGLPEQTTR